MMKKLYCGYVFGCLMFMVSIFEMYIFNIFDSCVLKCFEVTVSREVSVLHSNKKKPSNNELFFICESYYVVSPILFTTALTI